jgi:hypothetical protein
VTLTPADIATAQRLHVQHRDVLPLVEQVRTVADALNQPPYDLGPARRLADELQLRLLAHEHAEEAELLPIMARALGGVEVTSGLSRTHAEIEHQIGRLNRTLVDDPAEPAEAEDVTDVRRLLYGLYAILRLHNAQEEEGAFSLVPEVRPSPGDDRRPMWSGIVDGCGPVAPDPADEFVGGPDDDRERHDDGQLGRAESGGAEDALQ